MCAFLIDLCIKEVFFLFRYIHSILENIEIGINSFTIKRAGYILNT